ncbi:DUF6263 family protein [Polaribacter sargassicola]|uniref:DUF6263 family protein n=1 Tax=Polaribacter sargassicola TaxID=2836891 RepID=UPI001F25244F|nr:DUF6263 family protein [Polaribacter sp. DS7-9]MCG1037231.1 hypothetical protein [Polaribacter sp. DS7-9]
MKKLLVLFLVVSSTITFSQESVLLRLNYKKGEVYTGKMSMNQDMGSIMSMAMNVDLNMDITEVSGDNFTSQMKFTKLTMNMLQGGVSMSFDSSKSADELDETGKMMKAQMDPMLKATIVLEGNNLGEVNNVSVTPSVPGVEDMAKQYSSVVYPKEAVKVGETWTMSQEQKGMKMDYTYTVKSISKDIVVLDVSGDVSGMGAGKITGEMTIDVKSGVPTKSKIDMKMSVQGQEMLTTVSMSFTKS